MNGGAEEESNPIDGPHYTLIHQLSKLGNKKSPVWRHTRCFNILCTLIILFEDHVWTKCAAGFIASWFQFQSHLPVLVFSGTEPNQLSSSPCIAAWATVGMQFVTVQQMMWIRFHIHFVSWIQICNRNADLGTKNKNKSSKHPQQIGNLEA